MLIAGLAATVGERRLRTDAPACKAAHQVRSLQAPPWGKLRVCPAGFSQPPSSPRLRLWGSALSQLGP